MWSVITHAAMLWLVSRERPNAAADTRERQVAPPMEAREERLRYVHAPRLTSGTPPVDAPRRPSTPKGMSAPVFTSRQEPATVRAIDPLTIGANTPRLTMTPAPARGGTYQRPLAPELRGTVPEYGDGSAWGGAAASSSAVASLRKRPAACVDGPGARECLRRLLEWRADSIFHVTFRCRVDSRQQALSRPPDCDRYLLDTLSTP